MWSVHHRNAQSTNNFDKHNALMIFALFFTNADLGTARALAGASSTTCCILSGSVGASPPTRWTRSLELPKSWVEDPHEPRSARNDCTACVVGSARDERNCTGSTPSPNPMKPLTNWTPGPAPQDPRVCASRRHNPRRLTRQFPATDRRAVRGALTRIRATIAPALEELRSSFISQLTDVGVFLAHPARNDTRGAYLFDAPVIAAAAWLPIPPRPR